MIQEAEVPSGPQPVTFYSTITGGKDRPQLDTLQFDGARYVMYRDRDLDEKGEILPQIEAPPWQIHDTLEHPSFSRPGMGHARRAMWHRWHPERLRAIPPEGHLIWIDANYKVVKDPSLLIAETIDTTGGDGVGVFAHPNRTCLYAEAEEHVRIAKWAKESGGPLMFDPEAIRVQAAAYRRIGYPENAGLFCTTVMIFPNWKAEQDPRLPLFARMWEEIVRFSYRDQIPFPFVTFKVRHKIHAFPYSEMPKHFVDEPHRKMESLEVSE